MTGIKRCHYPTYPGYVGGDIWIDLISLDFKMFFGTMFSIVLFTTNPLNFRSIKCMLWFETGVHKRYTNQSTRRPWRPRTSVFNHRFNAPLYDSILDWVSMLECGTLRVPTVQRSIKFQYSKMLETSHNLYVIMLRSMQYLIQNYLTWDKI